MAECLAPDQELEAIKVKLWTMEQAGGEPTMWEAAQEEEDLGAMLPRQQRVQMGNTQEKVEADHRSIYMGNVDYEATAEELEAYFHLCGEVHRITILCEKFSNHPKGYAYIEFTTANSVQAAMKLDKSLFRDRVLKVQPKRTNLPGISSMDRRHLQGCLRAREGPFYHSSFQCRARGEFSSWFTPY